MRLVWVVLTVVAMVLAMTVPATAKRPTTETVKVTMELVPFVDESGGEVRAGLTTDCDDGDGSNGYLLMTRDRAGLVGGPSEGVLGLFMNDVHWSREYPASVGVGLVGCHGDTVDDSPVENSLYGGIGFNIDRNGAVTDVLWHFDYYLDGTTTSRVLPNGKVIEGAFDWTVREYFTLTGNDLLWDDATSTVSGKFYLKHSLYDADTEIGYEPFPGPPREMAFTVIIDPWDG